MDIIQSESTNFIRIPRILRYPNYSDGSLFIRSIRVLICIIRIMFIKNQPIN